MPWVLCHSNGPYTLARSHQLTEMRAQMMGSVSTQRSPAGRGSGACKASSNRNRIQLSSGLLGSCLSGRGARHITRNSTGLKYTPPEPAPSGARQAETMG